MTLPPSDRGAIRRCSACGCRWRDNGDNTVSLADFRQRSCAKCEPAPFFDLDPAPRYEVGQWLRFLHDRRMVIGVVSYTHPAPYGIGFTYVTDAGLVDERNVLEAR